MAQLALQEALRGYGLAAAAEGQALVPGSRARRDAIEGLITRCAAHLRFDSETNVDLILIVMTGGTWHQRRAASVMSVLQLARTPVRTARALRLLGGTSATEAMRLLDSGTSTNSSIGAHDALSEDERWAAREQGGRQQHAAACACRRLAAPTELCSSTPCRHGMHVQGDPTHNKRFLSAQASSSFSHFWASRRASLPSGCVGGSALALPRTGCTCRGKWWGRGFGLN